MTTAQGLVEWVIVAALDGVIGLAWGLLLIPVVTFAINPALKAVTSKGQ